MFNNDIGYCTMAVYQKKTNTPAVTCIFVGFLWHMVMFITALTVDTMEYLLFFWMCVIIQNDYTCGFDSWIRCSMYPNTSELIQTYLHRKTPENWVMFITSYLKTRCYEHHPIFRSLLFWQCCVVVDVFFFLYSNTEATFFQNNKQLPLQTSSMVHCNTWHWLTPL